MTKKEKKLLIKYIFLILGNTAIYAGIFIYGLIKAGIYVID